MGVFPIAVVMERRRLRSRWADEAWSVHAVLPARQQEGTPSAIRIEATESDQDGDRYLVSGLAVELFPDEDDGYFENWIAPEPKVFVLWRMQQQHAMPVLASISYAEGARMLDSGESADGVPMPHAMHAWLGDYLQTHYRPRSARRGEKAERKPDERPR